MFIAVEGIDGSGKGTQCRLLNKWIREKGFETYLTAEPTNGPIGRILREGLKKGGLDPQTEALLFAADRSEHIKEISRMLEKGRIVITERYLCSSFAYQGASGLDMKWLKELNRFALLPDIAIYLDVAPGVALKRISSLNSLRGRMREKEHFEKIDVLAGVRELYLGLVESENMVSIDASGTIEDTQAAIRRKVSKPLTGLEEKKKRPAQKGLEEYF